MTIAPEKGSVTSHSAPRDDRMIGYSFPNHKDKTPLDFTADPKTGLDANGNSFWGVMKEDLRKGIEGAVLPPLFTWKQGKWLEEMEWDQWPIDDVTAEGTKPKAGWAHNIWVVHGEGTPGNYAYRCYLLPSPQALDKTPKHPMMWKPKEKKGKVGTFKGDTHEWWVKKPTHNAAKFYHASWMLLDKLILLEEEMPTPIKAWSFHNQGKGVGSTAIGATKPPTTQYTPPKPLAGVVATQAPALPTGVRFRCAGCGHWYDEAGFKAHGKAEICAGKDSQQIADWTVMCHKDCGCEVIFGAPLGDKTLDHVSQCKPGFPRKKEEVKMEKPAAEAAAPVAETTKPDTQEVKAKPKEA